MRYVHQFTVNAPLDEVAAFHSQSASMARITPPPIRVEVHNAPKRLSTGAKMSFTMHVGPLSIPWQAQFPYVGPTGFVDSQAEGLFAEWTHRHIFVPQTAASTAVIDIVDAQLSTDLMKRIMGAFMWMGMPILFRYRMWMTRRILTRDVHGSTADLFPPGNPA